VEEIKSNQIYLRVTKGAIYALVLTLILIIIFAFIVKWTSMGEGLIDPINQIIKVVAILFGVGIALKGECGKTLLIGSLVGAVFACFAYILFAILSSSFTFDFSFFYDVLFSSAIGLISAIIVKFIKK